MGGNDGRDRDLQRLRGFARSQRRGRSRRQTRLHRSRTFGNLFGLARTNWKSRGAPSSPRPRARRSRVDDHARWRRLAGRLSRRHSRRRHSRAGQHDARRRAIFLHARGLAREGVVCFKRALAIGPTRARGGLASPECHRRRCRRHRDDHRPDESPRGGNAELRHRADAPRRNRVLALFVGLDRQSQGRASRAHQHDGDRHHLRKKHARHSRG
jgi:hypothetical protein